MFRPERTCIGCRRRASKSELLRLVARDALVVVDSRQVEPGRGAYLHHDPGCLDLAVRRRSLARALKTTLLDERPLGVVVSQHLHGRDAHA